MDVWFQNCNEPLTFTAHTAASSHHLSIFPLATFSCISYLEWSRVPLVDGLAWIWHCFRSKLCNNYPLGSHITSVRLCLKEAGLIRHMASINCEPESAKVGR